ncbi:MAG: energy coupling factor transporter S component ThiW [Promethearchaeota archaeon]
MSINGINNIENENNQTVVKSEKGIRVVFRKSQSLALKVALTATFTAVGVLLSYINPFAYITIFGSKPNPFAHLINALTGVIMGPFYSILIATLIAIIRYSVGIGSILAFPGGISGAVVVGFVAWILSKKSPKYAVYASLTEPIGTVFIGGTISNYLIPLGEFYAWWGIFAVSTILGTIIAFILLITIFKNQILIFQKQQT